MALSWSIRRQLLYYGMAALVLVALSFGGWKVFLTNAPTCFDAKQNGAETGVDCGGTCALICANSIHAPVKLWARSFQTSTNTYTTAAYVQNSNVGAGARGVHYVFQLFDDKNSLVKVYEGYADIPPVQIVPIVVPNIDVGNRTVKQTYFEFVNDTAVAWYKVAAAHVPALHVTGQNLSLDGSRLSANVVNDSVDDVEGLTAVAVLFDAGGVARAASKTTLPVITPKSSQEVVFTWPIGTPDIVRAEITLLLSRY
jgi:hypothetical protein